MKKFFIGTFVGMISFVVGVIVFIGIVAHDNTYSKSSVANEYWGW